MFIRSRRLVKRPAFWLSAAGAGVIGSAMLFCVSGCSQNNATAQGDPHQKVETLQVITVNPRPETIRRFIEQPGHVTSYEETPIYTKLAGYLQNVRVDIGDKLKKGDLLCSIYVPEVKEDVEVKRSRIDQAKADIKQAKALFDVAKAIVVTWEAKLDEAEKGLKKWQSISNRWKEEWEVDRDSLKNGKVLDLQTVEEAENQYKAAQARLREAIANRDAAKSSLLESHANRDKAQANVEVAEAQLGVCDRQYREEEAWWNYHNITAPYDGIVTHRNVHTWHFVQPSNSGTTSKAAEPLFVFMRTDLMRVVIQVPEYDAPLIKVGAPAIVKVQSLRNREIPAKVERSSWSLNQEARTLRTEIWIKNPLENPKEELQSGMYVNVKIVADLPNVMSVPLEAVLTEGSDNYIYVLEDGKAKRVTVRLGVANDRVVQVISKMIAPAKDGDEAEWGPLTGHENVIISNLDKLKEGQSVTKK